MAKVTETVGKAAARAIEEVETRILTGEGHQSVKAKVGRAKHTARKAAKAAAVVIRDRRKLKKMET